MASAINIQVAKDLVIQYRSITLADVEEFIDVECFELGRRVAKKLTGFSGNKTCKLCLSCKHQCQFCIYGGVNGDNMCCDGENYETYFGIVNAETPEELIVALNKRANHIEGILKKLGEIK